MLMSKLQFLNRRASHSEVINFPLESRFNGQLSTQRGKDRIKQIIAWGGENLYKENQINSCATDCHFIQGFVFFESHQTWLFQTASGKR